MARKTETPKVPQHLLSDDESRKWKVVDIAVVSPTSVTALLQNNQEWCIDTFVYDENEYQRSKRICLQTNLREPPLLLSYVHVGYKLKHFVCTKTKLHLIDDGSESIEKSVSLSAEPSALCVEDNKVYISNNETKTLMFFKLELPTERSKIYLKDISNHDSIAEFVVHSKNIYVCTKGGKVSSHKVTGEKQHDYRNRKSKNYKARGVAVFTPQGKECNLLLVTWSDNTLYIYSTKNSHDLLDIDLNVPGKFRVTTSCFLMSSEVNDVAVYNMKTVADRGAFKMILVSGSREEDLSYLIDYVLHDTTAVVQLSRNFFIKRRNLTTLVEMYDYSCITNDNLNAEKKKLKDEIDRSKKEKDDLTVKLKNTRSNLSRKEADLSDVKVKLDDARTGRDELRIMNEEKEEKCCSLSKQLEAERKTTEELKDEIDRRNKEKDDVAEELENTRSNLSRKEAEFSDVKAKLDEARTESNDLRRKNEENEEICRSLTKQLEAERKATEEDEPKVQEKEEERWSKMFSAGHGQNKTQSLFVSHLMTIFESQEDDKMKLRQEQMQAVVNSMEGKIKCLEEGISKSKAVLNELEKSTVDLEADKKQLTLQLLNCPDEALLKNGQESVLLKVKSVFDEFEEEIMKREEQNKELAAFISQKMTSFKDLEISRSELSEEYERLSKEVTLSRFLSDTSKFEASQRDDSDPYWFNDTDPVVSESMDSGVGTSNLETDDCTSDLFTGNFDQICQELKVAVTVSSKGTQILIPDTGVELYVPGGSLLSRQLIEIKIIDFDNDKFDALFSLDCNASVAVQLLPNRATLRWPARLRLPHCLRLKANFQELKSHVRIYRSEHEPGQDIQWEHDPELKYELKEDCCIIYVKKFCSLRYDVIDDAIDATKVTVFTSGKQHGTSMELAVGYHLDLPGRREMLLTMNNDMKIFKAKPFEFMKGSAHPLQVHLTTAVSRARNYEERTTEVDGKLSVAEAAAKIAKLPLDRPKPSHLSGASHLAGNQHISTAMLKVSDTVLKKGTTMRILDTGIELAIPPNAFKGYPYIEMSVIPFGTLDEPISTFSSNSSVIVELLPNKTTFSTPVRLSLPHCLKLKKDFSKDSVKVYLSHHEKDQKPFWEELPDAKYELKADHCVIYLTSFCWVKYEIDNKIVVAKRIKVYTATRGMERNDQIAEVEVGYFIDMPGRAETLRENVDLKISQCKPLLFFKEGNLPLQIFHIKVLPMFWKYCTPERNPKVIPYKSIADSLDTSVPFVFENQDASEQKPFVMFKVSQGNEEVEINIRL